MMHVGALFVCQSSLERTEPPLVFFSCICDPFGMSRLVFSCNLILNEHYGVGWSLDESCFLLHCVLCRHVQRSKRGLGHTSLHLQHLELPRLARSAIGLEAAIMCIHGHNTFSTEQRRLRSSGYCISLQGCLLIALVGQRLPSLRNRTSRPLV